MLTPYEQSPQRLFSHVTVEGRRTLGGLVLVDQSVTAVLSVCVCVRARSRARAEQCQL